MVGWSLGDEHAIRIADALKCEQCRVKILRLNHNRIGSRGIEAIMESIEVNKSLEEVYLSGLS